MKIKKLLLQSSQPEIVAAFYNRVLQLPLHRQDDCYIISLTTSEIIFKKCDSQHNPFYHFAINIPANSIEPARSWLAGKAELLWLEDYHSDIAAFVNWHAKSVYFFDPGGNIVELIARFDLKNDATGSFTAGSLLSVNEVGIVFPQQEIDTATEKLMQQYNTGYFDKQKPLPHFKAVGNDEGLFIIVPEHRSWYPTQKQSGIFPITVEFENENHSYKLILG
jgi:hypothetical protein